MLWRLKCYEKSMNNVIIVIKVFTYIFTAKGEYIYDRFKVKEHDIINGIIRRIDERKNVFIEFDGIEAILPPVEQSPADTYRVGERIKVYLAEVEKTNKFPKIVISRIVKKII